MKGKQQKITKLAKMRDTKSNGFDAILSGHANYASDITSSLQCLIFDRSYKLGESIQISDPKQLPGSTAVPAVDIPILLKGAEVWVSPSTNLCLVMCIVKE